MRLLSFLILLSLGSVAWADEFGQMAPRPVEKGRGEG